jgi:ribosomal protein L9
MERKLQKMRDELDLKDCSLREVQLLMEDHDRQNVESLRLLKQQMGQEKGALKEQLIQCESHIEKLERKVAEQVRKEQCLYGRIKKYEACIDAKKNLRQIEQQELDRINLLLSLQ